MDVGNDVSVFLYLFLICMHLWVLMFVCSYSCHFTASKFTFDVPLNSVFKVFLLAYPAVISSACGHWPFPNSSLVAKDGPEGGAQTHSE